MAALFIKMRFCNSSSCLLKQSWAHHLKWYMCMWVYVCIQRYVLIWVFAAVAAVAIAAVVVAAVAWARHSSMYVYIYTCIYNSVLEEIYIYICMHVIHIYRFWKSAAPNVFWFKHRFWFPFCIHFWLWSWLLHPHALCRSNHKSPNAGRRWLAAGVCNLFFYIYIYIAGLI